VLCDVVDRFGRTFLEMWGNLEVVFWFWFYDRACNLGDLCYGLGRIWLCGWGNLVLRPTMNGLR